MFNLFKINKPRLVDLIPMGFIDIHSHVLPHLDDGSRSVNESISLIEGMENLGFGKIIATPHTYPNLYNNTNYTIKKSYEQLKSKLKTKINVRYASEYLIDKSIEKKISEKSLLTIKENYVLVEMSYMSPPINLHDIIFKLIHNGYKPILAHPERYPFIFKNFDNYFQLKKYGLSFQINLLSTVGFYGEQILKVTNKLIEKNLVDYVGSDIHSKNHIESFYNQIKVNDIKKLEKLFLNNFSFN